MSCAIALGDIVTAESRLRDRILRTPVRYSPWLSRLTGGDVWLKLESLQVTSSFKLRGAWNAVLALLERLPPDTPPPRLVTASAGNHGRALAHVAAELNLEVTIFTPREAPRAKLDAIARLGADLRPVADSYEHAERLAKAHAEATGQYFLSPYSHPDLIAGAGTIALELIDDCKDLDLVVVPVGGGGLASGVAAALKASRPAIEVVGVEAEASHPFTASLAAGRIVEVKVEPTLADGLAGNMDPETVTFDLVRRLVDRIVLASEIGMRQAIRGLLTHEHLIAEGAASVGAGALLDGALDVRGRRAALIITGANIDTETLVSILGQPCDDPPPPQRGGSRVHVKPPSSVE